MKQYLGLLAAGLMLPGSVLAGPELVEFPEGYRDTFSQYAVINRPTKKQVVYTYANPLVVQSIQASKQLPSGSVVTMEVYKAKLDEKGNPIVDEKGKYIPADMAAVVVMEKRTGWGAEYPEGIRNTEWEYAKFKPGGGKSIIQSSEKCLVCHKQMANKDFIFSFDQLIVSEPKPSWYGKLVDVDFVGLYARTPIRKDVVVIDSRPARKYHKGHIVPAINIPQRKFDEMTQLLPENKSTLMIFYCGGLKCPLSHKSAFQAEKLGYTNIVVYPAGYPDWLKAGQIPGVSESYVKKAIDKKAEVLIVDARPPRKFQKGHVPTAVNIPFRQFDEMLDKLPADKGKQIIYYCGGYKCVLSAKSAKKAIEIGYTKVKLFQAGWPTWKAAYSTGK